MGTVEELERLEQRWDNEERGYFNPAQCEAM